MSKKVQYYVYIHKSKKDGRIFYVGKGKGNRHISHTDRNFSWHKIVKEEGFISEIVKYTFDEIEAYQEEIRLIRELGRKDLGLGQLINLTDGGEGNSGLKWNGRRSGSNNPMYGKSQSQYMKDKLRSERKGKPRPQHVVDMLRKKSTNPRSIFLNQLTGIYYEGVDDLHFVLNISKSTLFKYLRNNKLQNIKKV